jgi:hypothetical protein
MHDGDAATCSCTLSLLEGSPITLWSLADPMKDTLTAAVNVQIDPRGAIVVGRQHGGETPYLDPSFLPTQIVPESGDQVLRGVEADNFVSRGHFMLRAAAGGILLVNGVPRRGGGLRPPLNGTWLEEPEHRELAPGEEYLIVPESNATIRLPNGCSLRIGAERPSSSGTL